MKGLRLFLILAAIAVIWVPNLYASTLPFEEGTSVTNPQAGGEDPFQIQTTIPAVVKEVNEISEEIKKLVGDKEAKTEEKAKKVAEVVKHTVKAGDSLWVIAQKLLGDGSRYREIIEANKAKYPSLEKNPDLIHSGWVLDVPKEGESATATAPAEDKEKTPAVKVDKDSSSSTTQVSKLPNWSIKEKIDRLQKALDSANRKLLSQNKRIAALNPQTIRFLIDNKFMTEEEWMAMNPPVGFTYRLDKLGKIELVDSKNIPLTNADIAKLEKVEQTNKAKAAEEAKKADEAKKKADEAKKAEEAKKKEDAKKNGVKESEKPADKKEEKPAENKTDDKKIEEEAKKVAETRYQKMLAEMGMPDVSGNKDYYKAVRKGSDLLSKGFFGGTTAFYKFVNTQDYPYYNISDLQSELKSLQSKYEELVAKGKTDRFLGIFGSTIESTGKHIDEVKAKLQKAWAEMKKALDESKAKAGEFQAAVKAENTKIASLQKELDSMDIYDSANAKKVQDKMKEIKDSKKSIEDAEEKLACYDELKKVFKI